MKKINNNSCLFLKLLPVEIAADIFSRLPFDSVLQCKLVCKTWRDLLIIADHHHSNNNNNNNSIVEKAAAGGFLFRIYCKEPGFYYGEYDEKQEVPTYNFNLTKKAIFNHQYHPFVDIYKWYVVGSCNGLICLQRLKDQPGTILSCEHGGTDRHDMYVCNPYTGEYAKLPNPNLIPPSHEDGPSYGFGYHPITKEYKVIRIYYQRSPTSVVHVQVYTLGSDTCAWRSIIGEIKHKLLWGINKKSNNSGGILSNGVLYWLIETRNIISFDMADEEFRDILTTQVFHGGPSVLGVLNGCLCFSTGWNGSTHIWVMNNNDYSWSKKFSISWRISISCRNNNFRPYFPLAHLESGKILLHSNFDMFFSYDPETEHAVELKMRGDRIFDMIPYMKTTVSLKALGEKEAIQVTAIY